MEARKQGQIQSKHERSRSRGPGMNRACTWRQGSSTWHQGSKSRSRVLLSKHHCIREANRRQAPMTWHRGIKSRSWHEENKHLASGKQGQVQAGLPMLSLLLSPLPWCSKRLKATPLMQIIIQFYSICPTLQKGRHPFIELTEGFLHHPFTCKPLQLL